MMKRRAFIETAGLLSAGSLLATPTPGEASTDTGKAAAGSPAVAAAGSVDRRDIASHQRQVHLDFHTPPFIGDVGRDFAPQAFAARLEKARVDSITVFAKCHHGMSYYPTKIGTQHPA